MPLDRGDADRYVDEMGASAELVGLRCADVPVPPWARRLYGLPALPTTDLGASLAGRAVRRTALAMPGRLAQNPAQRDALARLATA